MEQEEERGGRRGRREIDRRRVGEGQGSRGRREIDGGWGRGREGER